MYIHKHVHMYTCVYASFHGDDPVIVMAVKIAIKIPVLTARSRHKAATAFKKAGKPGWAAGHPGRAAGRRDGWPG